LGGGRQQHGLDRRADDVARRIKVHRLLNAPTNTKSKNLAGISEPEVLFFFKLYYL
jgi:hypothetical protein